MPLKRRRPALGGTARSSLMPLKMQPKMPIGWARQGIGRQAAARKRQRLMPYSQARPAWRGFRPNAGPLDQGRRSKARLGQAGIMKPEQARLGWLSRIPIIGGLIELFSNFVFSNERFRQHKRAQLAPNLRSLVQVRIDMARSKRASYNNARRQAQKASAAKSRRLARNKLKGIPKQNAQKQIGKAA